MMNKWPRRRLIVLLFPLYGILRGLRDRHIAGIVIMVFAFLFLACIFGSSFITYRKQLYWVTFDSRRKIYFLYFPLLRRVYARKTSPVKICIGSQTFLTFRSAYEWGSQLEDESIFIAGIKIWKKTPPQVRSAHFDFNGIRLTFGFYSGRSRMKLLGKFTLFELLGSNHEGAYQSFEEKSK